MPWFKKGWEANQAGQREAQQARVNMVRRYWMRPGTSGRLVWLDEEPFGISEHHLKINGDWRNWFSCLAVMDQPCAFCDELGHDPEFVSYLTVGDISPWTDKKGNTRKFSKTLFPAKSKVLPILQQQIAKRGGIVGAIYEVTRGTERDLATGSNFDFEEKVDILSTFGTREYLPFLKDMKPAEYLRPFEYEKILHPLAPADARRIVRRILRMGAPPPPDEPADGPENGGTPWPPDEDAPPF